MNKKFLKDFYRMTGRPFTFSIRNIVTMIFQHNLRFMYLWRKYENNPNIFTRLRLLCYTKKYGLEISTKATIGEGFYLGHAYNVTIAENVKIGKNVNIHKGCTIGREVRGKRIGVPTIENNVYLGINSTIVGNITIGNDVMIAPNSFVNFDVPDHLIVVGNPGIIKYKHNAVQDYVNFSV